MQKFCVGRKKQKVKLCRRKGEQPPKIILGGEMEKSAQFTSLWSQTLVECKEALQGGKKRKHLFNDGGEGLKILYKIKMLIFLVCHLHLSRSQQSPSSRRVPTQPWLWCWHIWTGCPCKTCSAGACQNLLFGEVL